MIRKISCVLARTENSFRSTGQRNTLVEYLCWSTEVQRLSQPLIQLQGDTLWELAEKRYRVPVWLLRQYNPTLDFSALQAGTRLAVPRIAPREGWERYPMNGVMRRRKGKPTASPASGRILRIRLRRRDLFGPVWERDRTMGPRDAVNANVAGLTR